MVSGLLHLEPAYHESPPLRFTFLDLFAESTATSGQQWARKWVIILIRLLSQPRSVGYLYN